MSAFDEYMTVDHGDRSKTKRKRNAMSSVISVEDSASWQPVATNNEKVIKIILTYDLADNLVHIKLDKNCTIPRTLMKVIGLILQFQTHLTTITINRGLNFYTVHELNNWLSKSNITDICLDDTFVKEANYHILLETRSSLKNLSLARCRIDDNVLKHITSKLLSPHPASRTLALLNLASNRITDLGATYLGDVLRANRQLYYLNLADNMITDDGASKILNVLTEFPLKTEEILTARYDHMFYLKEKAELCKRFAWDLKSGENDKKFAKRKSAKPTQTISKKSKGLDKEFSKTLIQPSAKSSLLNIDSVLLEKATIMAEDILGRFNGPFHTTNTVRKDDITYCLGNNVLCYLNLAYNNLSFLSVKKLLDVVITQKLFDRKPRGLVKVCIEGNNIPLQCVELANIDDVLEMGLMACHGRKQSAIKKKSVK